MVNCVTLKNALFHNLVHIIFVNLPCIALLTYFIYVNSLKGLIISSILIFLVLICCIPIFKCTFLIILDMFKKQTIIRNNHEIKMVKACYLSTGLFGKRAFITDLRKNYIDKLDFYISDSIDNNNSDKKHYQRVRMCLHHNDFSKTDISKNLKCEYLFRDISYTLNSYLEADLHIIIDVEYYRFSKMIKSFKTYERRMDIS